MHKSFAIQSRQDIYAHYKTPSNRLSAKYLITYAKLYAENSLISPRSSGFFGPHPNQYIQCVMICTVQKRKIDRPCPAARSKMIFKIFRSIFTCTLYYCKDIHKTTARLCTWCTIVPTAEKFSSLFWALLRLTSPQSIQHITCAFFFVICSHVLSSKYRKTAKKEGGFDQGINLPA